MPEMADRWGWSYNSLKSNANGNMSFSFKKAMVYAGRLKVRAEWLYSGEGEMRPSPKSESRPLVEMPVIGWVQAGTLSDVTAIQTLDEGETIIADTLPPGTWFATDVRGDSMDRISPEGSRIYVNAGERQLVAGGFYLFSLRGETTFKRYYEDPVPRLEPYSWNPANRPIFLGKKEAWEVIGRVHRTVLDIR
jgi:SOS-response transcriptional repressor LexA